jgi:hypothetical protein
MRATYIVRFQKHRLHQFNLIQLTAEEARHELGADLLDALLFAGNLRCGETCWEVRTAALPAPVEHPHF